jgi:hypothetical protein
MVLLGGNVVVYDTAKQTRAMTSSSAAEANAATQAVKHALLVKEFVKGLGCSVGSVRLFTDCETVVKQVENGGAQSEFLKKQSPANRIAAAESAWLRDLFVDGEVKPVHIPGEVNVVDLLTKRVEKNVLEVRRDGLFDFEAFASKHDVWHDALLRGGV